MNVGRDKHTLSRPHALRGPTCECQLVTRSFTSSTRRSTAWTPCFAALAPWCITVVATRLMRVTGDCLRAVAVDVRLAADFFRAPDFAEPVAALFRLAAFLVFAERLVPRAPARFDAVDVLRRAFPPDDFDAGAMITFLKEGTAPR